MAEPAAPPGSRRRVWFALLGAPLLLALAVMPFALVLARSRGLEGDALMQAMEPIAVFPLTVGFLGVLAMTLALARRDGLGRAELGWRAPAPLDVAIGLGVGALVAALDAAVLHPWVRAVQPEFEPTLPRTSVTAAAVTLLFAVVAEDTLYRGYALHVLRARHGTLAAVAVTAVGYALITPSRGVALPLWAVGFGLVLAGVRLWRGSLVPVVLAHLTVGLAPKLLSLG